MPLLTLHLSKSCIETMTCVPHIVTYAVVEEETKNKVIKVHNASIGAVVVGKKACLRMKRRLTVKKSSL